MRTYDELDIAHTCCLPELPLVPWTFASRDDEEVRERQLEYSMLIKELELLVEKLTADYRCVEGPITSFLKFHWRPAILETFERWESMHGVENIRNIGVVIEREHPESGRSQTRTDSMKTTRHWLRVDTLNLL